MARHDKNYTDKCSSKYSGKLEVHLTALRNDQHCFPQRGSLPTLVEEKSMSLWKYIDWISSGKLST